MLDGSLGARPHPNARSYSEVTKPPGRTSSGARTALSFRVIPGNKLGDENGNYMEIFGHRTLENVTPPILHNFCLVYVGFICVDGR